MVEQPQKDADRRERMFEKAEELGRMLGQTAEYGYLQAANDEISDDRDATELMNRAREKQQEAVGYLERGEQPPEDLREELEDLRGKVQGSARYQSLISAQTNFDKLMDRIHRAISRGMKKGEESRIIIPS